MSTATLYQIGQDLDALRSLLEEVGGDVTDADADEAVTAWLAETGEALASKVDRYCALVREMETRADARDEEANRLAGLAATDRFAAKRLKDRLHQFLQQQEIPRLETERFRLSVAQNGGKLPLHLDLAAEQLPEPYRITRTSYAADQDKIRAALEAGASLPFAALGTRGSHLRIK